jgi:hypothetical protein
MDSISAVVNGSTRGGFLRHEEFDVFFSFLSMGSFAFFFFSA